MTNHNTSYMHIWIYKYIYVQYLQLRVMFSVHEFKGLISNKIVINSYEMYM